MTPVRDDGENLIRLGECLLRQSQKPEQWVIVDNGSTDGTRDSALELAARASWISVIEAEGEIVPTRGVPISRAFALGLKELNCECEVIVRVDADVSMAPGFFARLLAEFEQDADLGIASGSRFEERDGMWQQRFLTGASVEAQCRAYRRICLEAVLPLEEHRGWDSADVVSARLQGWRSHVARDLPFKHHRAIGTRDGSRFRAWSAEGVGAYSLGYRPLYLLIRSLYHSVSEPAAIGLVMGYVAAFFRRSPRASRPVRRSVRQEQTLAKLGTRAQEVRGKRSPAPEVQHGIELLLVTEPGGPLLELCALRAVWAGRSRVWATLPGPDSGALLHGESVVLARGPTCRSLVNLVRNLWIAWRAVGRYRPAVILATGSGIVVPFIWVGRLRGVRTIFLECGGVVDRPSLSCRLVAPAAQFIYVQWPELIPFLPSARYAGTVPWRIGNAPTSQIQVGKADGLVVAVVGTSLVYPFDRLVRSLHSISGVRPVIIQRGISSERPARATVFDFVDFDKLADYVAEAQLVVTHGGIGSVLLALAHGKHPIVMPRRQDLGEAVDDHQVAFAERLQKEGLAKVVDTEADLMSAVLSPAPSPVAQASEHTLVGDLATLVEELLSPASNRRSVAPTGRPSIRVPSRYRRPGWTRRAKLNVKARAERSGG